MVCTYLTHPPPTLFPPSSPTAKQSSRLTSPSLSLSPQPPPKKRGNPPAPGPAAAPTPAPRRSKLAKEHDLTPSQESSIRDAFGLFARRHESYPHTTVIRASDARRVMIALGFEMLGGEDVREMLEVLDPEGEGWVAWEHFVGYAAVWFHAQRHEEEQEEREGRGDGGSAREEVERAFRLFTGGAMRPIRVADLKRVARELREEVDEEVLWDMVVEANGERRSKEGVGKGVEVEEFEQVMRRAGVFG
ncbi:ef-hand superfamily ca2+-modulated protein [Diplodia corticola]|uniref:Ef-hand superfamily ca2+-modulated protein n=1 Tax=Diplodia corticola TaxID=236234 RepID=A0A1J9RTH5_9PEZI|nr:ef-hand superfamily ca2+-modulated protein [Diplodia corticola]OJD31172.1 ef-hand superfamily ca2+-modulated protein [Diplodia corticola]